MKHPRGFTLLEVIVALALMATVLVSSILAFARHHEQLKSADQRLEAVRIADGIVSQMIATQDGVPLRGQGAVLGKANWYWRTETVGATQIANVPLLVVRFQIVAAGAEPRELVSVNVVRAEKVQ